LKLIKTTLFSSIITFIRIATGFISNKVVAIFVGPSGIAILGQFVNFFNIALTFSNGAISTGVIKYTAEFESDKKQLKKLMNTSLMITLYSSLITAFFLIVFASSISNYLFSTNFYSKPIFYIGLTIVFYSLNNLILSVLNGIGDIKKYTLINSIGSVLGLLLTIVLVYYYNIIGAIYSLVFAQAVVFFFSLILVSKKSWFSSNYFNFKLDFVILKKLSHFSLMAIVASLTLPISQIFLRNMITSRFGIDDAGIWQGMMRISDGYLLLITTSLSVYYLPKLSSICNDNMKLKHEIFSGYRIIIPTILFTELIIFLFRENIIQLLFSNDFSEMSTLFFWQLSGDFLKIIAWVLSYLLLARSMTKIFIFSEILFTISYVALGYIFTKYFSLKGISIAFCVNYFLYFLYMIYIFRDIIFLKNEHE
jgi:O-antigen/teichoic acid export membrane protein